MSRPQALRETLPSLAHVVLRFWPHVRQQHRLIAGAFVALFAEIGLRLLEPWPLKFVLDRVIVAAPARGQSGVRVLDALDPMTLLTLCALAVVAFTGLRAMAEYCSAVAFGLVGHRTLAGVRREVHDHVQRLSLSFHDRARSGDLTLRMMSDVETLKEVTVTALLPLVASVLVIAGMFSLMLYLNWQLALVALAPLPILWILTSRLTLRLRQAARSQRHREGAMASAAAEALGAMKVVQALALERIFGSMFASENQKSLKEGARTTKLAARLERTVDLFITVATALVLWRGAQLVMQGVLTPGDLVLFLAYLKNTFKPTRDFAKYTTRVARAAAAGDRVLDLLDRAPDVRDLPGAAPAPVFRGAVRFERVRFGYEPPHAVLQETDFDIPPGCRVAIVGSSGSGKSTLISLLMRLYDPWQGRVVIDGRDIREYTLDSLRAQIGIVLQDSWLFAASVHDNIRWGLPDADVRQVEAAARLANAHEFIQAMPQGYDTILGERGITLSNGQRQRIAIARAAIKGAPILLLDEPTTGLDRENARTIIEALEPLTRGRTVFLVTHDLDLAARSDWILCLEAGRLIEQGTHRDLLQAGGVYAALQVQRDALRHEKRRTAFPHVVAR